MVSAVHIRHRAASCQVTMESGACGSKAERVLVQMFNTSSVDIVIYVSSHQASICWAIEGLRL